MFILIPLFLASLTISPRPPSSVLTPASFSWPFTLATYPESAFASAPRRKHFDVSRALERLAWAYLAVEALGALYRIYARWGRRRSPSGPGGTQGPAPESESIVPFPLFPAFMVHLLAWRASVLPTFPAPAEAQWPTDAATVLGVAGGLIVAAQEIMRLVRLLVLAGSPSGKARSTPRPSMLLVFLHFALCLHRVLLASRVVTVGIIPEGQQGPFNLAESLKAAGWGSGEL